MKQATGERRRGSRGQALIEFALILPILFLLIVNVVNFGGMFYAWIAVSNAARTGAQYYSTAGAAVGQFDVPSVTAVRALVLNDIHALPNSSTAQVCVSLSTSATVSCNTGTAPASAPPAADSAEAGITYPVGAVDVTYTYTPLISLWSFPRLGIRATIPPTAIHRQATMRFLQ